MYCHKCGNLLPDDVKFCLNCGEKVSVLDGTTADFVVLNITSAGVDNELFADMRFDVFVDGILIGSMPGKGATAYVVTHGQHCIKVGVANIQITVPKNQESITLDFIWGPNIEQRIACQSDQDEKLYGDKIKPYYREQFDRIAAGQKPRFNWAAFFLNGWNQLYNGCTRVFCRTFLPFLSVRFLLILAIILSTVRPYVTLIRIIFVMELVWLLCGIVLCTINGFRFNMWYYQDITRNPQKRRSKKGVWMRIACEVAACAVLCMVIFAVGSSDDKEEKISPETAAQDGKGFDSIAADYAEEAYYIGDTVTMIQTKYTGKAGYYDITMTGWGTYSSPYASEETYIYVTFEVVNTGEENIFISAGSFNAYVHNYYTMIAFYDDYLFAELSPGEQAIGNVCIETSPDNINDLKLELGDVVFRIQDDSDQDIVELTSFSYDTLYLYGGSYEGINGTSMGIGIYSSFDERYNVGVISLYDSMNHETFATIRDDMQGEGIYTLCLEDSSVLYIKFYQDNAGNYCADIQGLDTIYTNAAQIETYIMTEQYIP